MISRLARLFLSALLLAGMAHAEVAKAEVSVPPLTQRVTDLTGTLSDEQRQTLESRLAAFEAQKGAQLAVLLVPTTAPETIEQYGIRVVEAWKLGRKGVDDGVLLLIAKDDRKLRIEVGYGLEGALNDATANRIIDEHIVPQFKQGAYYGGVDAGVAAIIKVVDGEPLPAPKNAAHAAESAGGNGADTGSLLFVGFVLSMLIGGFLRTLLGRLPAATLTGSILGGLAWLFGASLMFALFGGLASFVLVLLGGIRSGPDFGSHGGFGGGSYGGGSGGYDSGGFSGGGGSFGGGGASGDW